MLSLIAWLVCSIDTFFDEILDASSKSDVSLDFIVPYLSGRPEADIKNFLSHLESYASKIPKDSELGKSIVNQIANQTEASGTKDKVAPFLQAYGEWHIARGETYKAYALNQDTSDTQDDVEYDAFRRALEAPVTRIIHLENKIRMIVEDSGGEIGNHHIEAFNIISRDLSILRESQ